MRELLTQATCATEDVLAEPAPFVLQMNLNDFTTTCEPNVYTRVPHRSAQVLSDLHERIQDRFNRDGNTPAMPAEYLPPLSDTTGFRLLAVKRPEENKS